MSTCMTISIIPSKDTYAHEHTQSKLKSQLTLPYRPKFSKMSSIVISQKKFIGALTFQNLYSHVPPGQDVRVEILYSLRVI